MPTIYLANNAMKPFIEKLEPILEEKIEYIDEKRFADNEYKPKCPVNIRKSDVFYLHSFGIRTPDKGLMELLAVNDMLKRASANEIIDVVPYLVYSRQDRKDQPRVPITARLVANLIEISGATRIITSELHSGQIQGFYNIPLDNLYSDKVFEKKLKEKYNSFEDFTVVYADRGALKRENSLVRRLDIKKSAYIDKTRVKDNVVEQAILTGSVKNRIALLVDDIIDTGGTLITDAQIIRKYNPKKIIATATHAVFSPKDGTTSQEKLEKHLDEIIVTDSIPYVKETEKIKIASLAELYTDAMKRTEHGDSLSALYE